MIGLPVAPSCSMPWTISRVKSFDTSKLVVSPLRTSISDCSLQLMSLSNTWRSSSGTYGQSRRTELAAVASGRPSSARRAALTASPFCSSAVELSVACATASAARSLALGRARAVPARADEMQ